MYFAGAGGIALIEIEHLYKVWDDNDKAVVLKDINVTIQDGDIYALVGRSGAGKSTLLRCINGLTDYQSGSLRVDGREIKGLGEKEIRNLRRHIGMIFQQFSLLERETVYDNVALPMKCWKYPKASIDKKVLELLDLVGLSEKAQVRPRNLSGGQKQRVAIARALTMEPSILLCDEATSALDPKTTLSILDLLKEINRKIGITIVVVTHQMEVVRKICRRACIMEHGEVAAQGSVKDIFIEQPRSLMRLLGEGKAKLPEQGHNIRIAHLLNSLDEGKLFGQMYADLQCVFPIISGKIQSFEDDRLGIFVINVDDSQMGKVAAYLTEKGASWTELLPEVEDQNDEPEEDE